MLVNGSSDSVHESYVRHVPCINESMAQPFTLNYSALVGLISISLNQQFFLAMGLGLASVLPLLA